MTRLLILLIFVALLGCTKNDDGYRLYVVKAGHERSSHMPSPVQVNKNSCDISYITDDTWVWSSDDEFYSEGGIAKIAGFSDGFHRNKSCRLGYRHNYGIGEVGLFVEVGSNYYFFVLDTVQPNMNYSCRLSYEGMDYVARQGGNEVRYTIGNDCWWGYRLYPCMAGSYRLHHDWNVWLRYD